MEAGPCHFHVLVPGNWSVKRGHDLLERLEEHGAQGPRDVGGAEGAARARLEEHVGAGDETDAVAVLDPDILGQ